MSSSRQSGPLKFVIRAGMFLLVLVVVGEVWFRTVMPACQTPMTYQQNPATVCRFDPRGPTPGLFTVGRFCLRGGKWRINNEGWNSSVDYFSAAERGRSMIALFGDSYIEGFLTDADQHVDAYLPKMLPGTDSYAFGCSGWYLEQYVAVSRYARERYQPDLLVIFINEGDVSDSLHENGTPSPSWWQIAAEGRSFKELPPTEVYMATRKARLAKKSALVNYLRYNAKLSLPGMRITGIPQPAAGIGTPAADAATSTVTSAANAWRELLPAAGFMVQRLCAEYPSTPIIFAALGDRYLPVQEIAHTPPSPDFRAVEAACEGRPQCSTIDLRYSFSRDWAANGVRFESADGGHWNAYGNRLVARSLADFITQRALLPNVK